MSNVVELPRVDDLSWNIMRRELLRTFKHQGFSPELAERITAEAESFHRLIFRTMDFPFVLPESLSLSREQIDEINVHFDEFKRSLTEAVLAQRNEIQAQVVALLVQKHTGWR